MAKHTIHKLKPIVAASVLCLYTSAYAEDILVNKEASLSAVVVTATAKPDPVFDIPVSLDVVKKEELHDSAPNMNQLTTRLPGLQIQDRTFARDANYSSRGFGARNTFGVRGIKFYQDGVPFTYADGFSAPGIFDPYTIESVEFMRGSFSTLYGSTSSGVLQFFTYEPKKVGNEVDVNFATGNYGTKHKNIQASGLTDTGVFYLVTKSDYEQDGYRANSNYDKKHTDVKLGTYFNNGSSKLTVKYSEYDLAGGITWGMSRDAYNANPRAASFLTTTYNPFITATQTSGSVRVEHAIDKSNRIQTTVFMSNRESASVLAAGSATSTATTDSQIQRNRREASGFELRYSHDDTLFGRPVTLDVGYAYSYDHERASYWRWMNDGVQTDGTYVNKDNFQNAKSNDFFTQFSIKPIDKLVVHGGLRFNKTTTEFIDQLTSSAYGGDNSGGNTHKRTTPVFGVLYHLTPTTNIFANWGKGFETPSFMEMVSATTAVTAPPNTTIQPSDSKNYEVGVKSFLTDKSAATLTYYESHVSNEIVITATGAGLNVYGNVGRTVRKGIEASYVAELPAGFGVYGTLTTVDAYDADTRLKLAGVRDKMAFGEASWKNKTIGLKLAVEGIYAGKQPATNDNTVWAESYTLFNATASLTQKQGNWTFKQYARLNNIADTKNIASVVINDSRGNYFEPGNGRNWLIGLTAKYKF